MNNTTQRIDQKLNILVISGKNPFLYADLGKLKYLPKVANILYISRALQARSSVG